MPIPPPPLTDAQLSSVLDSPGRTPCSGVDITSEIELRPAGPEGPRLHATIFRPTNRSATPAPALLAFHGGGFFLGHPDDIAPLAKTLALTCGVLTLSASYRLGTAETPTGPGILADAAYTWRWIHRHAGELGLDPTRIAVAGESAGVLLAGHLAVRSPWVLLDPHDAALPRPTAFYANWGALDFIARWFDNHQQAGAETNVIGPGGYPSHPAAYHQFSVLTHAHGRDLPPTLFVYGRHDPVVHPRQGLLGHAAWQAAGAPSELLLLDHIGHGPDSNDRACRAQWLLRSAAFCTAHHA